MRAKTANVPREDESLVSASPGGLPTKAPERMYFEVNLLKLSGVLFCLDKAEATRRKAGVFDFEKLTKQAVTITPNPIFGYPSVLACRICDAILKKLSDYGQPVPDHVSFTKRELDELVGHASWGGRNGAQLARALHQLQGTTISARLFDKGTDRWSVSSFSVLSEVLIAGRGSAIEACSVRPNPLIVASLRAKHYTCLNYERMRSLDVVGRQMFKRVFYHLSNLYDGQRRAGPRYVKDYGAICREWLGGLRELRYISKIEQEQLGPHLRALQACGLIHSYQIARNARRDGFNIIFIPGNGFFEDYARFYSRVAQPNQSLTLLSDRTSIQQPLELVAHFYKRLYRIESLSPRTFSEKEVSLAKQLLERMTLEEAKDLVSFAIGEAVRTNFDVKTFGAVRQYVHPWRAISADRARARAVQAKRETEEREESVRHDYAAFLANAVNAIRASLSVDALAELEEEAKRQEEGRKFQGELMVRIRANKIIAERFNVLSFAEWRSKVA